MCEKHGIIPESLKIIHYFDQKIYIIFLAALGEYPI